MRRHERALHRRLLLHRMIERGQPHLVEHTLAAAEHGRIECGQAPRRLQRLSGQSPVWCLFNSCGMDAPCS